MAPQHPRDESDDAPGGLASPRVDGTSDALPEGQDGTVVTFQERLWPQWWVWSLALGFAAFMGIAYGYAISNLVGWLTFGILAAIGCGMLALTTPTVRVDDAVFRAGPARLPLRYVGDVRVLEPEKVATAHRASDSSAFLLLRRWAANGAVGVVVADERDPHPYWLVSTRSPNRLAEALRATRDT